MANRRNPHRLENPGPVIGEMRRCRDVAIRAASSVKSHGVIYHALQMVVVAIDGAAHVIMGQPYYFSEGGTGPSESERARTEPFLDLQRQTVHAVPHVRHATS